MYGMSGMDGIGLVKCLKDMGLKGLSAEQIYSKLIVRLCPEATNGCPHHRVQQESSWQGYSMYLNQSTMFS